MPSEGSAVSTGPMAIAGRGLRALHRLLKACRLPGLALSLRRSCARHSWDMVIRDFDGNLAFKCSLHTFISSHIFWDGGFSRSQLRLLDRVLRKDMVYMDVGANAGEQVVFAAKRLPEGAVIAFEPVAALHARLAENVALNRFTNVRAVRLALGDTPGAQPMFGSDEPEADGTTNEGAGTLFPRDSHRRRLDTAAVERLDDWAAANGLERLDVLKIDVEGAELAVLRGGELTLRRFRPLLIVEVHVGTYEAAGYTPHDLFAHMRARGYAIHGVFPDGSHRPLDCEPSVRCYDVVGVPDAAAART